MDWKEMRDAIAELKSDFGRIRSEFSLEHISRSGRRFGAIPEWETRLTVNGLGASTLFRRRGPGDTFQRPPGRFEGRIPDPALLEFLEVLRSLEPSDLISVPPGPRDPTDLLQVRFGSRLFTLDWGFHKPPAPPSMARLRHVLTEWNLKACPTAQWSLTLAIDSLEFSQGRLSARLGIENLGSQSIHLTHPASPGFGSAFGVHLKFGAAPFIEEGITPAPIEVQVIPWDAPPLSTPRLLEIYPGQPFRMDFSAHLEGEAPHGWIGKFAFLHYLPDDTLAGIPVFNGALFTEERTW